MEALGRVFRSPAAEPRQPGSGRAKPWEGLNSRSAEEKAERAVFLGIAKGRGGGRA